MVESSDCKDKAGRSYVVCVVKWLDRFDLRKNMIICVSGRQVTVREFVRW